ncbi:MAG: PaaI family thioesterase [Roseovarius sp.]
MSSGAASDAARDGFAPFREDDSLLAFIGEIGVRREDGAVWFEVRLKEGALNPLGILHGGALASLFDVAMYEVAKAGGEAVTVSQETKFLSAIRADAPLYVKAEALRVGRKTVFCTARATQGDRLCGHATAQFARLGDKGT